eukprot:m.199936 g.199936  ORF g.199936 m.199936 type:complete len:376 (-) comp32756_c0_seq1:381-1508(-)
MFAVSLHTRLCLCLVLVHWTRDMRGNPINSSMSEASVRPRPPVFLIGGMKCGTTALAQKLHEHPQIQTAIRLEGEAVWITKEIHFFSSPKRYQKGAEFYYRHFRADNKQRDRLYGPRYTLDATPNYLYTTGVAAKIKHMYPTEPLRFLAVLRDPISRAVSQFNHMVSWAMVCAKNPKSNFNCSEPLLQALAQALPQKHNSWSLVLKSVFTSSIRRSMLFYNNCVSELSAKGVTEAAIWAKCSATGETTLGWVSASLLLKGLFDQQITEFLAEFPKEWLCLISYTYFSKSPNAAANIAAKHLLRTNADWKSRPMKSHTATSHSPKASTRKLSVQHLDADVFTELTEFFTTHGLYYVTVTGENGYWGCSGADGIPRS